MDDEGGICDDGSPSTTTTFRIGSELERSLCDAILGEYKSSPGVYSDVRVRFDDGSIVETSKLLLASISELMFECLLGVPSGEDALILATEIDATDFVGFLNGILDSDKGGDEVTLKNVIDAFGFSKPPDVELRKRAYHCQECDVSVPKDNVEVHLRNFHGSIRGRKRSPIWNYFEKTEHPDFNACKRCRRIFKCKGQSTSSMIRHLEMQHPDSYEGFLLRSASQYEENSPRKEDPKRRSVIWNYFSIIEALPDASSCNYCTKVFKCRGQTSSMIRHLKLEHPDVYSDYAQSTLMVIPQTYKTEPYDDTQEESVEYTEIVPAISNSSVDDTHKSHNKKRSSIWNFFVKTDIADVNACKACPKVFKCKGQTTSSMIRHLRIEHPTLYHDFNQSNMYSISKCNVEGVKKEVLEDEGIRDFISADVSVRDDEFECEDEEDEEDDDDDDEEDEEDHLLPPNKRSMVWYYFNKTEIPEINSCKLCSRVFKCKKYNTSVMIRHLRRAHPECHIESNQFKSEDNFGETDDNEQEDVNNETDAIDYTAEWNPVADYFQPTIDDDALRECKTCFKVFREENGTGMYRHLKSHHGDLYVDLLNLQGNDQGSRITSSDIPTKYKKRSLIWNYFNGTDIPDVNGCKACSKVFKCKGQTTSSMIRHLKIDHKELFEEFSRLSYSNNGTKIGESPNKTQREIEALSVKPMPVDKRKVSTSLPAPQVSAEVVISEEVPNEGEDMSVIQAIVLPEVPSSPKHTHKKRSSIWNYFVGTDVHEMNACKVCNKVFKCKGQTTSSMIRHLKKEHVELFREFLRDKTIVKEEEDIGPPVKRENKKRSPIWNYFEKTDVPEMNECKSCKKAFKCKGQSTSNMIRHLEGHHPEYYEAFLFEGGGSGGTDGETSRICPECGKQFMNRAALSQHMKVAHSGSRPYKCEECNMTFARRESYESHSHNLEKRIFLCTICGKTFARRSIRNFHEKAHRAEKKYECAYCPKKFLTNQRKYKHERTHTGEKPYQCTECGRQFTQSHHLVTHSRIHTGLKPYTCNYCPQTFRHLSSRNNHKCEGKLRANP